MGIVELIKNIKHNRKVRRQWIAGGRRIVRATVGWRRDPFYKQDGYVEVKREGPDDNVEYQKVIR